MELRPYQIETLTNARAFMGAGFKNVLISAATGAGKTVIACEIIKGAVAKNKRVAFLVDRLSLINQTSEVFDREGIDHSIMQSNHERFRAHKNVQLCSIQTVARRGLPADIDLLIVDECHTVHSHIKKILLQREIPSIGLTATPFTKGLGKIYDATVNVTTTNKLINEGFLSNYRIFACIEPNMEGVRVVAGEWEGVETSKRALQVVGNVVQEYINHGNNQKFICSAVDTAHVEELHRQFMAAGIVTANYTYRTSEAEREEMVNEFRKPDSYIKGLITVTAASKGFDVPDVGCIIMARPLRKSLAEHIQLFGRGLRIHPTKSECIVLDHSGNCERFWSDMNDFFESGTLVLDDGDKKDAKKKPKDVEKEPMKCPQCQLLHKPAIVCPKCGFEYPKRLNKVEHTAGTLVELIASHAANGQCASLWEQLCAYAWRTKNQNHEEARKRAQFLHMKITGNFSNKKFEPSTVEVTPAVVGKITQMNMAWAKRKAA